MTNPANKNLLKPQLEMVVRKVGSHPDGVEAGNSDRLPRDLHPISNNRYRALFTLARYWPAIGGSELHTRELVFHLRPYADVSVMCHHTDNSMSNEIGTAQAKRRSKIDRLIEVHEVAPSGLRRLMLRGAANLHAAVRPVRPLFDNILAPVSRAAVAELGETADLVHHVYNGLTVLSEQSLAAARKLQIPFVFTPLAHTHAPEGIAWSSKRFINLYERADALIAMTYYEREWLVQHGANPDTTFVCPVGPLLTNSVDPAGFRLSHGVGQAPLVLFLGRHVESKGYRALVLAAQQIWQRHPQAQLMFVGPQTASSAAFFRQFQDPRIKVIDQISDANKCSALAACDLLCVPSTQESLGVIYLEAWHYAKPVIAADIDVMQSVIRNNVDGLLVSPAPGSIAKAVTSILDDPEMGAALGKAGQEKTRNRYHWANLAAEMSVIHRSTLTR